MYMRFHLSPRTEQREGKHEDLAYLCDQSDGAEKKRKKRRRRRRRRGKKGKREPIRPGSLL